ncbi:MULTISPECIES: DNA recombination protein RmuC [unclassified Prosthecochloris]|uniref:DNA recombination protein RmuC n=1 Tax=unclassified Prosthecochloris TaxID=2632826 RepID=UPI00223D1CDD|nr:MULTISPECIES: DNA recombination protein RmuC [unclassified Prosthecochloris]UZJ39692.1 DNA recombination protein RmuC [Prosthecochloris sp. SCSIO W1102]
MIIYFLIAVIILLFLILLVLFWVSKRAVSADALQQSETMLRADLDQVRNEQKNEFQRNRIELARLFQEGRTEQSASLKSFEDSMRMHVMQQDELQRRNFGELLSRQEALKEETSKTLDSIRDTVEKRLQVLQEKNEVKLDEMRRTVDEKLQSTLEKRLTESFSLVSDRLRQVHEGLGEMKTLASGVGDLKKVLANVKVRGVFGEMQLGHLLANLLSPEQYAENVMLGKRQREQVEFAVKLPGKDDGESVVYLPVDAKFPLEAYYRLLEAVEAGDKKMIAVATKAIEGEMLRCAKDISDKYLNPPETTDFGILFLPTEGLFAEVVRNTALLETLQSKFNVIVAGPTTFAALLNSLQMGFRTLAIQKRTGEVWRVLAQVKSEFAAFGEVLVKAQNRITQAGTELDRLVGVRTRAIQRRLRQVEDVSEENPPLVDENTKDSRNSGLKGDG